MIWLVHAANQASSNGSLILSGEFVRSVDRPTLPLTPIPDENYWFHPSTKDVCDIEKKHLSVWVDVLLPPHWTQLLDLKLLRPMLGGG